MITVDEIRRWVDGFDPGDDPRAVASRATTLALLDAEPRPQDRSRFAPGHVTASGLVLSAARDAVLLVFHPRLRRWLQPGGHLEPPDDSIVDAARREVREETGIDLRAGARPRLVSVDVHDIPAHGAEPAHRHHDLMFGFVAEAGAVPTAELSAAWTRFDRLGELGADAPLLNAIGRAISAFNA